MDLTLTLILTLATAVIASLLTWHFTGRRQAFAAASYFATVWREGYLAGVADERTSAAWDIPGCGPNRTNPYPGPEQSVQHA